MRSVLYRFPDLEQFEQVLQGAQLDAELDLGVPSGVSVEDGEWVLAVFELGRARRATSAAARATLSPEGARLSFEPRDWLRLAHFSRTEAPRPSSQVDLEELHRDQLTPAPGSLSPIPTHASSAPPAPSGALLRPSARPPQNARVLIVDDDPDIRELVTVMLEAVALTVSSVSSAEDAFARVREEHFDLVVLDWNLPRMSGLDFCRQLRREPDLADTPVLFLTANAGSQDMVEAFASGADDYVVKPFRAPELGARIFSLLRRVRRP
ncbi:response regulator transcription factor [Chondromyces apiculatus]|uniref:Two component transcriptional regulator, winged helix family n=1 Tax=Chondromyces apiculatus DSM 436 TaxID=1192034 RepID=A0A017TB57_9BACT|nr:response regulator [Chondromyces apiculatus]EYF06474.1 two component transcriptional regulator, winged helix family [Chondromyces apiculatus DSM 436]